MNMIFKRKLPIPQEIKQQYPVTDSMVKIKQQRDEDQIYRVSFSHGKLSVSPLRKRGYIPYKCIKKSLLCQGLFLNFDTSHKLHVLFW